MVCSWRMSEGVVPALPGEGTRKVICRGAIVSAAHVLMCECPRASYRRSLLLRNGTSRASHAWAIRRRAAAATMRRAVAPLLLLLLLLSIGAGVVVAHPSRPDCAGPGGGHGPAAVGSGGFALRGPASGAAAGETAQLTLRGPVPFRGFLVVPADAAHGGAFVPPLNGARLACGGVGHSSAAPKDVAALTWRAPDAFAGAAAFTYYVVVSAGQWYGPLQASVPAVHGGANATTAAVPVKA